LFICKSNDQNYEKNSIALPPAMLCVWFFSEIKTYCPKSIRLPHRKIDVKKYDLFEVNRASEKLVNIKEQLPILQ
jgi:hypothetical protein